MAASSLIHSFKSTAKVGVYVDVANLVRNGGYGMRYEVLREFACRDSAELVRLNAYVSFDVDRASKDNVYRYKMTNFYSILRDFGYKVIEKPVKWYVDENGNRFGKANADLDMAVDALLQSENLDRVLLVTGDGDFVQVVRALQNKGCRVETLAFQHISSDLKKESDMFMSGYLIPNLLPMDSPDGRRVAWGDVGSRVRGFCYHHDDNQNFGFMRFLQKVGPGLWITDSRREDSPYRTAYFRDSSLMADINPRHLPDRNLIFEFDLVRAANGDNPEARNISLSGRS
ncbi:NYN domain-containing protein [Desulfurispira natronophila]|uniref:Uncharacterized LabA/DUF88 family protein n=1 Tax=Desulfurispira natronophila TaxID=682562 RepID=A0A7W7Y573_9BACT|nr:NYN domain-containing protein [Desulfurispira natronophila]MBB5022316.1 uncharacterized LabA/DUF88 family protein [Desulfurispira natronophila]